ncbi:NAD(P)-binding protein [Ramicandelaber brevisporus]|nr:NAD(P)-binding protein [Ramicandelaber brevisporus]
MKIDSTTVACITGAASGFGRALAERLASQGARVIIGDISEDAGRQVAADINARFGTEGSPVAVFQPCNVGDTAQLSAFIQAAYDNFGDLSVLVNNAGIPHDQEFLFPKEYGRRDGGIKAMTTINLAAVIEGTNFAMERWIGALAGTPTPAAAAKERAVINVASMAGLYPFTSNPVYAAAKAGCIHFTHALSPYAQTHNIRVNAIAPWYSKTLMVSQALAVNPVFQEHADKTGFIEIECVVDAMIMCIEDQTIAGEVLEVKPEKGTPGKIIRVEGRPEARPF